MAVQICLLGEARLFNEDRRATHLPTAKTLAALAMIVAAGPEGIGRRGICETLWWRSGERQARTNLRQALSALRKALGPLAKNLEDRGDVLALGRDGLAIDLDLVTASDERLEADQLETLISAGEFLQGIDIREPAFEDWLSDQRQRVNRLVQDRLERECERFLDAGAFPMAQRVSAKLIEIDNFNESAHRGRMRALEGQGEIAKAPRHFDDLAREERRGEVVVLRWEAGIGKSRLSQEVSNGVGALGFEVATCRVVDFGQGRSDDALGMVAAALDAGSPPEASVASNGPSGPICWRQSAFRTTTAC